MAENPGKRKAFRIALYACAAVIAVLAFYPLEGPPLTGHDKINHIFAFATLSLLADRAYPGAVSVLAKWILLLLAYGLFLELVQHQLPYREFSWLDFCANGFGILLYLVIARSALFARRAAS